VQYPSLLRRRSNRSGAFAFEEDAPPFFLPFAPSPHRVGNRAGGRRGRAREEGPTGAVTSEAKTRATRIATVETRAVTARSNSA
jgi:hypothetical protein